MYLTVRSSKIIWHTEYLQYTWEDIRFPIVISICSNTQIDFLWIGVSFIRFCNSENSIWWAHLYMRPPRTIKNIHSMIIFEPSGICWAAQEEEPDTLPIPLYSTDLDWPKNQQMYSLTNYNLQYLRFSPWFSWRFKLTSMWHYSVRIDPNILKDHTASMWLDNKVHELIAVKVL